MGRKAGEWVWDIHYHHRRQKCDLSFNTMLNIVFKLDCVFKIDKLQFNWGMRKKIEIFLQPYLIAL